MSESNFQIDEFDPPLPSDAYFRSKKTGPTFQLPVDPSARTPYYPEEVIRIAGPRRTPTDRIPNIPPGFNADAVSMIELVGHPLPAHNCQCWLDPFPTAANGSGDDRSANRDRPEVTCDLFIYYTYQLMDAARRFNRALYRSRRARFLIDSSKLTLTKYPDELSDEDPNLRFPIDLPEILWGPICLQIDIAFEQAGIELNSWLLGRNKRTNPYQYLAIPGKGGYFFEFSGYVDVVSSNGYIISAKIAADINPTMNPKPVNEFSNKQPGYQSSSHYSLSSKYSSP